LVTGRCERGALRARGGAAGTLPGRAYPQLAPLPSRGKGPARGPAPAARDVAAGRHRRQRETL